MINTISVDVEEYYHATNIEKLVPPARWHSLPSRVEWSTQRVLELFSAFDTKATFFILGCVARRHPDLVREIAHQGHEVASHGYAHRLAYDQTPEAFRRDVYRAKALLEDTTGQKVYGYRAPNFSIVNKNEWAYDILVDCGYLYDSSVYPTAHPRYSNLSKPREAYTVEREQGSLVVFPLAVAALNCCGRELRFPVAGGAYWRLLPMAYLMWGLSRMNRLDQLPCNCYLHPWEIDHEQPRFDELSFLTKIRHYGGIRRFPHRLNQFLKKFSFGPFIESGLDSFPEHFSPVVDSDRV